MTHTEVRNHLPRIKYTGGSAAALESILTANTTLNIIALDDLREAQNVAFAVTHPITGKQMEYKDLVKDPEYREDWHLSKSNELDRLLQGVGKNEDGTQQVKGYNCCDAIHKFEVEAGRTVTYARTVCTVQPKKDEPNRSRITAGGNLLHDDPGNVSTDTTDLELIKMHWQSVLSTENAKYMTIDIGNFYTNTSMDCYEYMRMHISKIPQEIIDEYNLLPKVSDGYVYFRIKKAIYGLKQSGTLAATMLAKILNKEGYYQAKHTEGLWLHKTKDISFTLVVDDFGVKYCHRRDAEELFTLLKGTYPCKCDWAGELYIGVHLDWD